MARMGVFSRNDSTPDSVPRSLQLLSHRHSLTTQYMRIVPNFAEILYPNESISVQVTNFIRTIPMQKPMLSRIRVVQRFCAVPLRILWQQWEDYIKGENEAQFLLDEPYIVNAMKGSSYDVYSPAVDVNFPFRRLASRKNFAFYNSNNSNVVASANTNLSTAGTPKFRALGLTSNSYVFNNLTYTNSYAEFAPRELGDYFGAPLSVPLGDNSERGRFSAFKFAAYQLAYSYFDRQPNVQTRIDDFYEMSKSGKAARGLPSSTCEFPPLVGLASFKTTGTVEGFYPVVNSSVKLAYDNTSGGVSTYDWNLSDSMIGTSTASNVFSESSNRDIAANIDSSSVTYQQDVIRSSWENVEKFPLKSGANLSMLAWYNDPSTGIPTAVPSNISLSRIRYANWQTDYFTSCNPWQQRGDEAQIPVSGTVSIDIGDLAVTFVPQGTVSTSLDFSGAAVSVSSARAVDDSTSDTDITAAIPASSVPPNLPVVVGLRPSGSASTEWSSNPKQVIFTRSGIGSVSGITATSTFSGNESTVGLSGSASASVLGLYVSPSNFRFAMTLQHIKEMQAQIDNRYQSYIHKFFGARARDYRLDRPEFIGGSVFELNVSDVTQTSETTESSNLADVAGKSVTADTSRTIRYHADEHCIILGTIHIIPDTEYINGLSRIDSTKDRFDWVLPQFGHLSEQAVYNSELVYNNNTDDSLVFGYEPIYNNLRWRKNFATCDFRDIFNFSGNREEYKPWLQIKDFGNLVSVGSSDLEFLYKVPTLSDQFLSGRYNRDNSNFVVTDDNLVFPFMVDSYFNERMVRIIPSRGTPTRFGA